jgi:hypothetical protein
MLTRVSSASAVRISVLVQTEADAVSFALALSSETITVKDKLQPTLLRNSFPHNGCRMGLRAQSKLKM